MNKINKIPNYGVNFQSQVEYENDLKNNYNLPGHPIAFSGINSIFSYYNGKLSKEKIKDILSTIENYTLHREYHKGKRNPSYSHMKADNWQMDLVDVQELASHNDGVRYFLTIIDCFTRFAWMRMLSGKDSQTVLSAFKSILNSTDEKPKKIVIDRGAEFSNRLFQTYCDENNILLRTPDSSIHGAYIERFNRTFQSLVYKYMTENETFRYIDKTDKNGVIIPVISQLIQTYNNRKHRMIGTTPNIAQTNPESHLNIRLNMSKYHNSIKPKSVKFNVGDTVRIAKIHGKFGRGYQEQSNQEIFKINKVDLKFKIPMYVLETFDGSEVIKGAFYSFELTKVNFGTFRIENVLKTRKLKNGVEQHYVKWKGFNDSYNSWVNAVDVTKKF